MYSKEEKPQFSLYCLTKKKHKINAGRFFQSCPYYWFLVWGTEVSEASIRTNEKSQHLLSFCNLHIYAHIPIDIRMLFTKMWELKNPLGFLLTVLPPLFLNFTNMENETSTVGGRILVSLVFTPRCCTWSHITWQKEVCKYIKFTN